MAGGGKPCKLDCHGWRQIHSRGSRRNYVPTRTGTARPQPRLSFWFRPTTEGARNRSKLGNRSAHAITRTFTMRRRRGNDIESLAKPIGGLIILSALAGGTTGLPERMNAIALFVFYGAFCLLGQAQPSSWGVVLFLSSSVRGSKHGFRSNKFSSSRLKAPDFEPSCPPLYSRPWFSRLFIAACDPSSVPMESACVRVRSFQMDCTDEERRHRTSQRKGP
jgi:hypothetical protein